MAWALKKPLFEAHMTFILGPRQVGKTSLAQSYLRAKGLALENYFNYDDLRVRERIRTIPYFFEDLQRPGKRIPLVFDEIHKMRNWKNYFKGAYDSFKNKFQWIVTGSGRLDLFQRGGEALVESVSNSHHSRRRSGSY